MIPHRRYTALLLSATVACMSPAIAQHRTLSAQAGMRIDLQRDWSIQSSAKVTATGDQISSASFRPQDWVPATIPSTVVAALVSDKLYPDPYYGMNLRLIPGTTYPVGQNFSNAPTPENSPFRVAWWYRTGFKLAPLGKAKRLWLNFDAINYRANIWLNGHKIAGQEQVAGMYRTFEFDVTDTALPGAANALAVEVFPPSQHDLTITFVDWNPMPADKDMGLVRDVYFRTSGPVALRNAQVITRLDNPPSQAHLTVAADLRNATDQPVAGTLRGRIGSIAISRKVQLAAGESTRIILAPQDHPQLNIDHPRLWWPYPLGPQNLYRLHLEFETGGTVSDQQDVSFGIREITSSLDAQQHRLFKINGRNILIRGGGWSPDMMLRYSPQRQEDEILYARDMHLNTIRLEGKMMNEPFFETCDRSGMLVLAGWCCCSHWERWKSWKPEDYTIAGESLRDQLRRLRNHPSLLAFLYGSDESPPPAAESIYLKVLEQEHWPNPYLSSAADRTTSGAGLTGVKMSGPYDYVAPNYWLLDHEHGGAFGFNTETSPGPAIPVLRSIIQMLPPEHRWPIDDFWNFHAGGGAFRNVKIYNAALEARYGKIKDLDDYLKKSQVMAYEGERAMFEAFGRNKYTSTGVVQWMLNNAWPSIVWHLYDYYLRPGGGYFGTKKANEPLHIQYSYDNQSVAVVNSYYSSFKNYKATVKVYNLDLAEKFSKTVPVDIGPDSVAEVLTLPRIEGLATVYFVKLGLEDPAGKLVSSNFYWLSTRPDVSNFAKSDWRYTPISTYANLTALETLPEARVTRTSRAEVKGAEEIEHISVKNTSNALAFFVHLTVLKGPGGADINPVFWEDNYFELMPGESREIAATFRKSLLGGAKAYIQLDGWNAAAAR